MTALTADRATDYRSGDFYEFPCAASKQFYKGAQVALDASGNAQPGITGTGQLAVGISQEQKLSTLAAAENIRIRSGIHKMNNSSGDPITKTEIGSVCYIEDDQTVCKTATGKSVAGYVQQLDSEGVWVAYHVPANANPSGALLVANNLSDVNDAPTSRANIGANKIQLGCRVTNLVGASAKVYRLVAAIAGEITELYSILCGAALATGDAVITASINGTPITTGVLTITQAGSAEGDIDNATPTAAKTVAVGDAIELTVSGTNTDADAFAEVAIYIET
jgi:hypothetical protein